MSQQNPTAPPQYSPDGQWWWNGNQWVPVQQPSARRSGRSTVLVLAIVGAVVAMLLLLLALLNRPIGSQVEMDGDLDESYCQMFPEDC